MLVVDATCQSDDDPKISTEPIEVKDTPAVTSYERSQGRPPVCEGLQNEIYRRRPDQCYAYHPQVRFLRYFNSQVGWVHNMRSIQ